MSHCALRYASERGAAKICQGGRAKRGSEATEMGKVLFFPPPTVGRFVFLFVYENCIFLHIKLHY